MNKVHFIEIERYFNFRNEQNFETSKEKQTLN